MGSRGIETGTAEPGMAQPKETGQPLTDQDWHHLDRCYCQYETARYKFDRSRTLREKSKSRNEWNAESINIGSGVVAAEIDYLSGI